MEQALLAIHLHHRYMKANAVIAREQIYEEVESSRPWTADEVGHTSSSPVDEGQPVFCQLSSEYTWRKWRV